MPLNAKEIRRRIKGFASTRQITKAMEMVAAAKVRRAQARVTAARPYAEGIKGMFAAVTAQVPAGDIEAKLLERREIKNVAVVVVTSDKGLSGAYNSNVLRAAVNRLREWREKGIEPKLIIIGTKGVGFFKHSNFEVLSRYTNLPQIPTFTEATVICEEIAKLYTDEAVDKVELVYTQFHSMLRYTPEVLDLLPATLPETGAVKSQQTDYIFEPSAGAMIEELIPKYLETVVFQSLLESTTSQLASQMAAMSSATKNAGEMIDQLTIVLNKARQGAITQEILEVVGGAEALNA
ncbi:ATP synthase F1 subunit gamma [bacterium]|nr:ATP synthase F1 subunit gamma [bacterium]